MSRYIATRAIRGANLITQEAEALLNKALAEKGADARWLSRTPPTTCRRSSGMTGREVTKLGELSPRARARQGPAAPSPDGAVLDALPGRDARLGHVDAAGGRDHRSGPLRLRRRAGPHPRLPHGRRLVHEPRRLCGERQRPAERPDRRHPAAGVGHPVGRRPHARLRRHRRLRQEQRSRREDRARAPEAQRS